MHHAYSCTHAEWGLEIERGDQFLVLTGDFFLSKSLAYFMLTSCHFFLHQKKQFCCCLSFQDLHFHTICAI